MRFFGRVSSIAGTAAVAATFAATLTLGACEGDRDVTLPTGGTEPADADFTLIGKAKVLREGLFEIGDLDGNGVLDYAWLTPKEKSSTGAIRVYLMENPTKTLSIRHIVPGKWGFTGYSLAKGDRFGESIAQIGDVNGDGVQDLAVGAPGDSESGKEKGAVYVLLMKKDGSVLSSEKISAKSDVSLGRQHVEGESFGTAIHALQDVNGDNVKELSVESKDGSQTIVLLNKEGKSVSSLKFSTGIDPKVLEPRLAKGKIRVMPFRFDGMDDSDVFDNVSVKPAAPSQCFFNQSHCACSTFESTTATCLDTVATEAGKTVCMKRPCKEGYKCDCSGSDLCKISKKHESAYAVLPGTPSDPSLVYCGILTNVVERTSLVEGAPVPTPAPVAVSPQNAWTPTQCMCSREIDLHPMPSKCLDFLRTEGGSSVCAVRDCKMDSSVMTCDATGSSVCAHESVSRSVYTKDAKSTLTVGAGEAACELTTITKDVVACIDNCPTSQP